MDNSDDDLDLTDEVNRAFASVSAALSQAGRRDQREHLLQTLRTREEQDESLPSTPRASPPPTTPPWAWEEDVEVLSDLGDAEEDEAIGGHLDEDLPVEEGEDSFGSDGDDLPVKRRILLELYSLMSGHPSIPKSAGDSIIKWMERNAADWSESTDRTPSYKSIVRQAEAALPQVRISVEYLDKLTKEIFHLDDLKAFPQKKLADHERFEVHYISTSVSFKDVADFHMMLRPGHSTEQVYLSNDGVPENKSSGRSIDVTSVKFGGCRCVYVLRMILPKKKKLKINCVNNMTEVLQEITAYGSSVYVCSCDLPKKAQLMCMKAHGGRYACSYCLVKGSYDKTKKAMVYPWKPDYAVRSLDAVREIANRADLPELIASKRKEDITMLQGVMGVSPFLGLPAPFDMLQDFAIDYQHNVCLGVVRDTIRRTFKTDNEEPRALKNHRQDPFELNQKIILQKVPSEFARRTRILDQANWKASEWRTLAFHHFPVILSVLTSNAQGKLARDTWALLCFCARSMVVDDEQYETLVSVMPMQPVFEEFAKSYELYFGTAQATLNVHLFSHLPQVRERFGPVTNVSTFPFEASYKILKDGCRQGTISTAKQSMYSVMSRQCDRHNCQKSPSFSERETFKYQNNLIWLGGESFHRILEVQRDEGSKAPTAFVTRQLDAEPYVYSLEVDMQLPFHLIGVWRGPKGESEMEQIVPYEDVKGKAVIVEKEFLVALPLHVLLESD